MHFKRWGALYILAILFLGSWVGQFATQVAEVKADAREHKEPFVWADFWPQFWAATFENWQSEFLQLAVQAVLIASILGRYVFAADDGADKEDVERILKAIEEK
jgi:hypothetical protein